MKYQHCILLPFALALLVVGLVTLLLWGIGNLEPYNHTKDFTTASCTVVSSNYTDWALCTATQAPTGNSSGGSKNPESNRYPCLVVLVNYTEESDPLYPTPDPAGQIPKGSNSSGTNSTPEVQRNQPQQPPPKEKDLVKMSRVVLYDTFESWAAQRDGDANTTCSMHLCDSDIEDTEDEVQEFYENYGQWGESFQCFFNPRNEAEVYAHVVTGNNILHALVWPALAMGFGLFLLIVFIFQSCEVWVCRNPKLQERRLQGQTYHLAASYHRNPNHVDFHESARDSPVPGTSRHASGKAAPSASKSRLPKLSSAADIIRKLSFRGRSSSSGGDENKIDGTVDSSRSFGGVGSQQWSITKDNRKAFSTT